MPHKYRVFALEVGAHGTPHKQGFVNFWQSNAFEEVKAFLPSGAHIETAHASMKHTIDYVVGEWWGRDGRYKPQNQKAEISGLRLRQGQSPTR